MKLSLACLLTVLIEAPFFALCGYRTRNAIVIIVCVNIITNLVMNVALALLYPQRTVGALAVAEAMVVVAEYFIYSIPFGKSWKLFFLTLAANALSCGLGLFLWGWLILAIPRAAIWL